MKQHTIAMALIGLFSTAMAQAADFGFSADIGTLGAGLHLIVPVQPDLNARVGFNAYNYSYSGSTSEVNYDFKLKLQTIDALLDWYPMSGSFRLSAGIVHNGNKITSTGNPAINGNYTVNGNTYSTAEVGTINGTIDFRSAVPYLGLGWGNAISKEKGWGFSSDFGVISQGTPSSTLTSTGCSVIAQICTQFASDLAVENANLEQKMNNFKLYPVIRLGVTYSF